MTILHIVRELSDDRARSILSQHCRDGHKVCLLLLHDAVLDKVKVEGARVVTCEADVRARGGVVGYETVDYDGMVRMILEADRVISW